MLRLALVALLLIIAVALSGCGGSTSGSTSTVNITDTSFFPQNLTITATNRAQWVVNTSGLHQVVSGTLSPTPNPQLRIPVISINQNNAFTPNSFEANYGDTVQWQNNRSQAFLMDIVDSSNTVRATLSFAQTGQIIQLNTSQLPSAGAYTYQQQGNSAFSGQLFLFGAPTPNQQFQSQVMSTGGSFSTQFNSPGVFPYYDLDQSNPNRSFRTGTITVQ